MVPPFLPDGNLPSGIYGATWAEVTDRFGWNDQRRALLDGLRRALITLSIAGCRAVYIDGSFVTAKDEPRDYDACWGLTGLDLDRLDPVLLEFDDNRAAQRAKFGGELFPAQLPEGSSGRRFLEFFQIDRETGAAKGIIVIVLPEALEGSQ